MIPRREPFHHCCPSALAIRFNRYSEWPSWSASSSRQIAVALVPTRLANSPIYTGANRNPTNANSTGRAFDAALGAIIAGLNNPGLLDQTLILALGEFGRAIGSTDAAGNIVTDPGWSMGRPIRPEDIEATIYSALGIDYSKVYRDDPLNRGFYLVPTNQDEEYAPIHELWA